MKSTIHEAQNKMKLMNKNYLLILYLVIFTIISNAQCTTPSNLMIINSGINEITLDWSENGTANTWEFAVTPNYVIGSPTPNEPTMTTVNHPYTLTSLTFPQCYVFYLRSVCSLGYSSSWIPIASSDCTPAVIFYVSTLSNNDFSFNENKNSKIYPNPAENEINVQFQSQYNNSSIEIYDLMGRLINLLSTKDNKSLWTANISNLKTGIYSVVVKVDGKIIMQEKLVKR